MSPVQRVVLRKIINLTVHNRKYYIEYKSNEEECKIETFIEETNKKNCPPPVPFSHALQNTMFAYHTQKHINLNL